MAALNRPVTATYAVNETVLVDTQGTLYCQERIYQRHNLFSPVLTIIFVSFYDSNTDNEDHSFW